MSIVNINKYGVGIGTTSSSNANQSKLEFNSNWILKGIYPIGSIYLSVNNENPANFFGGVWERYAKGEVLLCVDENDSDTNINTSNKGGGSKTVTLAISNMPSHRHQWAKQDNAVGSGSLSRITTYNSADAISYWNSEYRGMSEAHNNIQPYITCYIWLRTE